MEYVDFPTVRLRVGQKLGIVAAGDTLDAGDGQVIGRVLENLRDELEALGIVRLNLQAGVESEYVTALVDMAAALLVDEYGIDGPRRVAIRSEGLLGLPQTSLAERRLRKLVAQTATNNPVRFTAY